MLFFAQAMSYSFLGNTVQQYCVALIIFMLVYFLFHFFMLRVKQYLAKWINTDKKKVHIGTVLLDIVKNIPRYFWWALIIYLPLKTLNLVWWLDQSADTVFVIVLVLQLIRGMNDILQYSIVGIFSLQWEVDSTTKNIIKLTVTISVWVLGIAIVLMNFGIQITPLLASLWIWGIAVAFALKNILEDMFSSFSILMDKPFKVGDFISVWGESGTVKHISLKSTRIKTITGQELILPNKTINESAVNNYAWIQKRRVKQNLWVTYQTSYTLLQQIPHILEEVVTSIGEEKTKFLWAVFKDYGPYNLTFQLVYYTKTTRYKDHLAILEQVNFAVFEAFEKHEINFAYPTQTLHLKKDT